MWRLLLLPFRGLLSRVFSSLVPTLLLSHPEHPDSRAVREGEGSGL